MEYNRPLINNMFKTNSFKKFLIILSVIMMICCVIRSKDGKGWSLSYGCYNCWAKNLCEGGCMAQVIHFGLKNNDSLPNNACTLIKEETELYLKISYLALANKRA